MGARRGAWLIALAILLSGAASGLADEAPTEAVTVPALPLSLADALGRAIEANLGIRASALAQRVQALGVPMARGAYDPAARLALGTGKRAAPCYMEQACPDGEPLILSYDAQATVGLTQRTPLGGSLALGVTASTTLTSTAANFLNPGITTSAWVAMSQPLLRGAGVAINRLDLERALQEREQSWDTLRGEVQDLIVAVHDAYWAVVARGRALELRLQSLDFARQQADMTRERITLGFAAPVELYAVEQGVAVREADVEVARDELRTAEIALRALLGMAVAGPESQVPLAPTDPPPVVEVAVDPAAALARALESDPALRQARSEAALRELGVREARNARLPGLDLNGSVGVSQSAEDTVAPEPIWEAGVVLSAPLGNRQARAVASAAELEADRAALAVARREQEVTVAVDAAVRAVESARRRIALEERSTALAESKLAAERERLERGESTLKNVLDYLEDRDAARLAELQSRIQLAGALIRLEALQGALVSSLDITLGAVGQPAAPARGP